MADLSNDDMVCIKQEHKDIINASLVSTSEFKAAHSKLVAQTPEGAEEFMLMLKCFTNLLLALLSGRIPFYRQLQPTKDDFQEYSPNSQKKITMDAKSSILWIILLLVRRFAQVNMTRETPCLGKFFHMVNLAKAKICETISHVEVTTDLLCPSRKIQSGKTQDDREKIDNREDIFSRNRKSTRLVQPYSADLKNIVNLPMNESKNPGINCI